MITTLALPVFVSAAFELVWTIANDIEADKQFMDEHLIQTAVRDSEMKPLL